jgi:nucleoside-diphosphate-sugar epimerase
VSSNPWPGSAIPYLPDLQALSSSVFVTGATGFIGRRLVSVLLEQGYRVRVMVRPDIISDNRVPGGCEQVPVALTDVDKLKCIVAESDAVIYCAGSVRGRKPADFALANIEGVSAMLHVLEELAETPAETLPMLLLSSLAASRPQLSDYARSKFEGEQLLNGKHRVPWTILRPPAVYGPGDREMLPVLKMTRRGLLAHAGPRDQRLSLLHVDDLANAMVSWLSVSTQCAYKTYAIDDGRPGGYSWKSIGEAVSNKKLRMLKIPRLLLDLTARTNLLFSSLLGYSPMLTPGKVRELVQSDWLCDNSDFTEVTGWKPQMDLKQGAQQLFNTKSKTSST